MPSELIDAEKVNERAVKVRDVIRMLEAKHKEELEPWKKDLERLKGQLQSFLEATNQESAKTAAGTFFLTTKRSASISNKDEFKHFVVGGERWDLLDWKANALAIVDFAEENGGTLPPGVNLTTKVDVNVRRPSEK